LLVSFFTLELFALASPLDFFVFFFSCSFALVLSWDWVLICDVGIDGAVDFVFGPFCNSK
jgi:hypothetical protein